MNVVDKGECAFQFSWLFTEWIVLPLTDWVKQRKDKVETGGERAEVCKYKESSFESACGIFKY